MAALKCPICQTQTVKQFSRWDKDWFNGASLKDHIFLDHTLNDIFVYILSEENNTEKVE